MSIHGFGSASPKTTTGGGKGVPKCVNIPSGNSKTKCKFNCNRVIKTVIVLERPQKENARETPSPTVENDESSILTELNRNGVGMCSLWEFKTSCDICWGE